MNSIEQNVFIKLRSFILRYKKFSLPSKMSLLGAILGTLGSVLTIMVYFLGHQGGPYLKIDDKIKELDNVKTSLMTINSYVDQQKKTLIKISIEK